MEISQTEKKPATTALPDVEPPQDTATSTSPVQTVTIKKEPLQTDRIKRETSPVTTNAQQATVAIKQEPAQSSSNASGGQAARIANPRRVATRRERSPTPKLLKPIKEYTEMELKVLNELKPFHRHFVLYDVTRGNNTASTLKALDMFIVHDFFIESDNLLIPFTDTLCLRDFRCLERPLYGDDCEMIKLGAMRFAIGRMADEQHWSMIDKTMIFDVATFTFERELTEEKIKKYVAALIKRHKPENIFEKELLIFPTFYMNGAFLTLVKNPKSALVGYLDPKGRNCEISHISAGSIAQYHDLVGKHIPTILKEFALHFEPKTPFGYGDHQDHELPWIYQFDKPYIILKLVNQILQTGYKFPDINDLVDEITMKRSRILKEELADFRTKLGEEFMAICQSNPTQVVKYAMAQRLKCLDNEKEKFKASQPGYDDDVIYID